MNAFFAPVGEGDFSFPLHVERMEEDFCWDTYLKQLLQKPLTLIPSVITSTAEEYFGPNFYPNLLSATCFCSHCFSKDKQMILENVLSVMPFDEVMEKIIHEVPEVFIQLLICLENSHERQRILEWARVNTWDPTGEKGVLPLICYVIDRSELSAPVKRHLCICLVEALSEMQQVHFATYCAEHYSLSHFAFVVRLFNEVEDIKEFFCRFMSCHPREGDGWEKVYQDLIEELAYYVDFEEDQSFVHLDTLLNVLKEQQLFDDVVFEVAEQFSYRTQVCVFCCSDSKTIDSCFSSYAENGEHLAQWLEELLAVESTHIYRLTLARELCRYIDQENFSNFSQKIQQLILEVQGIHNVNAMREKSCKLSLLLSYLFIALSDDFFSEMAICPSALITEVFRYALPFSSAEIYNVTSQISPSRREVLIEQVRILIGGDNIDADPMSFDYFVSQILSQALQQASENGELLSCYQEALRNIPSFLIALAVRQKGVRNNLLPVVHYFSDEQLHAFAAALPEERVVKVFKSIEPTLSMAQYKIVLYSLCFDSFGAYVREKIKEVKEKHQSFVERYQHFVTDFNDEAQPEIDDSTKGYQALMEEGHRLMGICRAVLGPKHQILRQIIQEALAEGDGEKEWQEFSEIMGWLEMYQATFQGPSGFFAQIEQLRSLKEEEEEEEENTIASEYWSYFTQDVLVHLSIAHAGILLERGIRSDKDFELLDCSLKRQQLFENIRQKTWDVGYIDPEKFLALEKTWKKLLHLKTEVGSKDFHTLFQSFLSLLNLERGSFQENQEKAKSILKALQKIGLPYKEWNRCKTLFSKVNQSSDSDSLQAAIGDVIFLAIDLSKKHSILSRMRDYLSQPKLDETWNRLHEREVFSLSQLVKLHSLTAPENLYQLTQRTLT